MEKSETDERDKGEYDKPLQGSTQEIVYKAVYGRTQRQWEKYQAISYKIILCSCFYSRYLFETVPAWKKSPSEEKYEKDFACTHNQKNDE